MMKLTLNSLFDYTNDDGIFTYLKDQNVPWKDDVDADLLDLDYHSKHGTKIVSKTITSLLTQDGLSTSAKTKLAKLLYTKNKQRWDDLYSSMSLFEGVNPLNNTDWTEETTTEHEGESGKSQDIGAKQNTFTEGQQIDSFSKGAQSNTFTKGSQENSQTKGQETFTEGAQSNTIGTHTDSKTITKSAYNSANYSPDTKEDDVVGAHTDSYGQKVNTNSSRSDSQTEGSREDTSSESAREDSTTKGQRIDTTEEGAQHNSESGTDSFTDTTTIHREGNIGVTTPGQMIDSFRKTVNWKFFEIIYKDIDDILCLEVFGREEDDFSDYNIVSPYHLPIASAQKLGGIKVGQNLTIASDGTLNAQAGGGAVSSVNGKTGEVTLDASDVGAASASDMTTAKADIVNIKLDINQLQGSVLDLTNRTGTNESDIVNIKLDINQLQGSVLGLHNDLLAVRQVPTGGTEGQVLTKGASGYDWQTPQSSGGFIEVPYICKQNILTFDNSTSSATGGLVKISPTTNSYLTMYFDVSQYIGKICRFFIAQKEGLSDYDYRINDRYVIGRYALIPKSQDIEPSVATDFIVGSYALNGLQSAYRLNSANGVLMLNTSPTTMVTNNNTRRMWTNGYVGNLEFFLNHEYYLAVDVHAQGQVLTEQRLADELRVRCLVF